MKNVKLQNRLHRLSGQLNKIQENLSAEQNCLEVVPQFLAVKGALAAAFEEYIKGELATCAAKDKEKMKKLLALLVRV